MLRLLEEFYFRYGFVGVAWVTPSSKVALGRCSTAIQRALHRPQDLEPPRDDFAPVVAPRPHAPKSRGAEAGADA